MKQLPYKQKVLEDVDDALSAAMGLSAAVAGAEYLDPQHETGINFLVQSLVERLQEIRDRIQSEEKAQAAKVQ